MRQQLTVFLLLLLVVSACARREARHVLKVPGGSKDIHTVKSNDGRITQVDFGLGVERNSLDAVQNIERQIEELGYRRCDKGSGAWESISVRKGSSTSESVRVLRSYRMGQSANVVIVFGEQKCITQEASCSQQFTVKFSNIPKDLPRLDQYLRHLCNENG